MEDEFEKYKNEIGEIDWGRYYADQSLVTDNQLPVTKHVELEDLRVFKLADELSDLVWDIVSKWDFFPKKTVGDQLVRAADSVGANIAEGYGRFFFGEYIVFLYYSRGSLKETEYWIAKAKKRGLVSESEYESIRNLLLVLPKELNSMIKNIKQQSQKWKSKPRGW